MTKRLVRPVAVMVATLTLATLVLIGFPPADAGAAPGFNPSYIVSNSRFFVSKPTMSVQDIQKFLDKQGARCRPNGGTPCLKDYKQATSTRPADKFCPKPYQGAASESAAEIIWKTSNACNIAPEVILVTLQKEQSLVTSVIRRNVYNTAMGYGCPDGAACSSRYFGLQNQIYNAAHQFQNYRLNPGKFNFAAGRTSWIGYNPSSKCGGTNVTIKNEATAALYNYTPYQPFGKGWCQTYGNLNFHRYYSQWFGDPQSERPAESTQPATDVSTKNNKTNTGTERITAKQVALGKDATPAPVTLALADVNGQSLQSKEGLVSVAPGAVVTATVSGLTKDEKPTAWLGSSKLTLGDDVKADDKGKAVFKVTAPTAEGKVVLKVGDSKDSRTASITLNVALQVKTLQVSMTDEQGKAIEASNGVYTLKKSSKVKLTVKGFDKGEEPVVEVIPKGKSAQKVELAAPIVAEADKPVVIPFTVPRDAGDYTVAVSDKPTVPQAEGKEETGKDGAAKDGAAKEAKPSTAQPESKDGAAKEGTAKEGAAKDAKPVSDKRGTISLKAVDKLPLKLSLVDSAGKQIDAKDGIYPVDGGTAVKVRASGFAEGTEVSASFNGQDVKVDNGLKADSKGAAEFTWKAPKKLDKTAELVVKDPKDTYRGAVKVAIVANPDGPLSAQASFNGISVADGEKVDPEAELTYAVSAFKVGQGIFVAVDKNKQKVDAKADAKGVVTFKLKTPALNDKGDNKHSVIFARSEAELDAKMAKMNLVSDEKPASASTEKTGKSNPKTTATADKPAPKLTVMSKGDTTTAVIAKDAQAKTDAEAKKDAQAKKQTGGKNQTGAGTDTDKEKTGGKQETAPLDNTFVFTFTVAKRPDKPTITGVTIGQQSVEEGSDLNVGDVLNIEAGGFEPGETVKGEFHSTPVAMSAANAALKASAFGWVKVKGEPIPALAAGVHHIVVKGIKANATYPFRITAKKVRSTTPARSVGSASYTLAKTGEQTGPLAALAIILLGSGVAVTMYARRNRPISVN